MKTLLFLLISMLPFLGKTQLYFPPLTGDTWETIAPESLAWCQENIDALYSYLETTESKAFIYLKDGKIVLEKYFGTFTKDSLHVWNSAGKTLTGMAVGIAQEEGYLSIRDTSSQYLGQGWTSLTPQQEEKITIRHQLSMTTGLNHTGDHYCTEPACLVYKAEPGTRWMYHNGPYTLLDGIIEGATGMTLNAFVYQKIRAKIGMNGLFIQSGYNNVNVSNARSMARFGLLMLNRGTWNTTTVLGDQTYFDEMTNSSQTLNPAYGYLTWLNGKGSYMIPSPDIQFTVNDNPLPNAPMDVFAALGKNGQIINVSPSQKIVMIRFGADDGGSLIGNQYNDTIWQKINALPCSSGLQVNSNERLRIYPNPVKDILSIEGISDVRQIKVFNLLGELLLSSNSTKQIKVKSLNYGVYLLEIQTDLGIQLIKFLKE